MLGQLIITGIGVAALISGIVVLIMLNNKKLKHS